MAYINGEMVKTAVGKTVAEYLAEVGLDEKRVAVERNGEIVPKATYEKVIICEEDTLEVVSFVGGG